MSDDRKRLPLFPLPNVVHFPQTELKLHIFEPRYRRLVQDLVDAEEDTRLIGMVLLKPGSVGGDSDRPEIYSAGTAGKLIDIDFFPDGRSNIVLRGDFRFEVRRELGGRPYRQAVVQLLEEPSIAEGDPAVSAVRRELVELSLEIASETGKNFPLGNEDLERLQRNPPFEEVVNSLAAGLDLPVLRKLQLLSDALPDRALNLLSVLRSRQRVLDLLRPYRRLAASAPFN